MSSGFKCAALCKALDHQKEQQVPHVRAV
uniref:Uncharacterized protein n=1 Tax=Arundo donax TaxID=35708 RepID=A0A0A9EQQ0_ARUDO